jgi:hypothetical protein
MAQSGAAALGWVYGTDWRTGMPFNQPVLLVRRDDEGYETLIGLNPKNARPAQALQASRGQLERDSTTVIDDGNPVLSLQLQHVAARIANQKSVLARLKEELTKFECQVTKDLTSLKTEPGRGKTLVSAGIV